MSAPTAARSRADWNRPTTRMLPEGHSRAQSAAVPYPFGTVDQEFCTRSVEWAGVGARHFRRKRKCQPISDMATSKDWLRLSAPVVSEFCRCSSVRSNRIGIRPGSTWSTNAPIAEPRSGTACTGPLYVTDIKLKSGSAAFAGSARATSVSLRRDEYADLFEGTPFDASVLRFRSRRHAAAISLAGFGIDERQ